MAKYVLRSKICELLGVEYPVLLAGMGALPGMPRVGKYYTGTSIDLVAAVSNAGGFAVLGAANIPPDKILEAVSEIRALTSKPFGIDLMFPSVIDSETQQVVSEKKKNLPKTHRAYYDWADKMKKKYALPDAELPDYVQHIWDPEYVRAQFDAALSAEGVTAICSGVGTSEWALKQIHDAGKLAISLVGNVRQAKRVAEMGTDIIVAQGTEAGGHTGKIGTLALVPQVVDAVSPIPVLAAGGIGNGRGLAAALCLGAKGVWVGTAFLAAKESVYKDECKQALIDSTENNTIITTMFTGKTCRVYKNLLVQEWLEAGYTSLEMPFQTFVLANLMAATEKSGKPELFFMPTGQVVGMIREIRSAQEIFEDMVSGAVRRLKGAALQGVEILESNN
ncbi:MAG: nitronate monooxygenase [Desulfobacteraceae bacterium]|jgi:NAD(P)H-dependent flavin oxidoreductase YrpB (nitropropane dioxygenase family)